MGKEHEVAYKRWPLDIPTHRASRHGFCEGVAWLREELNKTEPDIKANIDIRSYYEKKKGWWIESRSMIHCVVSADGQIIAFRREDAEIMMDSKYPHEILHEGTYKRKVWYFNETKDREIAEVDVDDRILANPSVLYALFLKRRT